MSAVYGVGVESDATDIALFFITLHHPASLSMENLKAIARRPVQQVVFHICAPNSATSIASGHA